MIEGQGLLGVALKKTILPLILVLLSFGCAKFAAPPPMPVYLIAVDALRVDALGCYGGARPTPFFDQFAKQAVLFENCLAPSSWTVPSMASLMTGLYPFHHGTTKALQEYGRVLSQQTLNNGYTTLAEALREAGYRTYGISANGHLAEKYGFAQGFDEFVVHDFAPKQAVAGAWAGLLPRITGEQRFGQGVFAFLFFFDPHHPYTPQQPYIDAYDAQWMKHLEQLPSQELARLQRDGFFEKNKAIIPHLRAAYDSEVAALDAYLGELLPTLPGYAEALVIITADHGESFDDHGVMVHGNNVYQPETHIPLLIKLPQGRLAGARIAAPVSLVDVMPTILAAVNAPKRPPSDGISLLPLLGGQAAARAVYAHIDLPWAKQRAMIRWPFKTMLIDEQTTQLYDLVKDPAETKDLTATHPQAKTWADQLRRETKKDVRFPPRVISGEIPAHLKQKLRELGYLQ